MYIWLLYWQNLSCYYLLFNYWFNFNWLVGPQEREVLLWRAGLSMINVDTTLCQHHNYIPSKRFAMTEVAVTLSAFTVLLEKVVASVSFKQFLLVWYGTSAAWNTCINHWKQKENFPRYILQIAFTKADVKANEK